MRTWISGMSSSLPCNKIVNGLSLQSQHLVCMRHLQWDPANLLMGMSKIGLWSGLQNSSMRLCIIRWGRKGIELLATTNLTQQSRKCFPLAWFLRKIQSASALLRPHLLLTLVVSEIMGESKSRIAQLKLTSKPKQVRLGLISRMWSRRACNPTLLLRSQWDTRKTRMITSHVLVLRRSTWTMLTLPP
jgi:hypothetical protein